MSVHRPFTLKLLAPISNNLAFLTPVIYVVSLIVFLLLFFTLFQMTLHYNKGLLDEVLMNTRYN